MCKNILGFSLVKYVRIPALGGSRNNMLISNFLRIMKTYVSHAVI